MIINYVFLTIFEAEINVSYNFVARVIRCTLIREFFS